MTVSTICTVSMILLLSNSSDSIPVGGPVAMNTVLGLRYLIFRLLFPRICNVATIQVSQQTVTLIYGLQELFVCIYV